MKPLTKLVLCLAIAAIAYVLCTLQAYFSMGEYKENISASCTTCSFASEILTYSSQAIIFFIIPCVLLRKAKTIYQTVLLTIGYMLVCFLVNDSLFISRHAAWSTYTTGEEFYAVAGQSYIFILTSAAAFCLAVIGLTRAGKRKIDENNTSLFFNRVYKIVFYLPYELYNAFENEGNLKYIIERKIDESISEKQCKYVIHINRITDKLFQITIKFKDSSVCQRVREVFAGYKELLPPWAVFPTMFEGSPRWNQGYEEDYCCYHWLPFWKKLSDKEKLSYYIKHNAPKEWVDWLNIHTKQTV